MSRTEVEMEMAAESTDPGLEYGVDSPKPPDGLSYQEVYQLLSNDRRRMVMLLLAEKGGTVSLADLSTQVACLEEEKTPTQLTSQERKRVYVSLYQVHLYKLAEQQVIHWDKDRGEITPGPNLEVVLSHHRRGLWDSLMVFLRNLLSS